jgi:tRNA pseudouridine55 synthase
MTPENTDQPSGILIIDKPQGITSHDVVDRVRRIFKLKKVGHAGTLDPMATGVLIILVGSATKWSDQLLIQDKTYQAEVTFGQATDTGDAEGIILHEQSTQMVTQDAIDRACKSLIGTREQQVPAYSAVKIGGQKLYDLARRGQSDTVARPCRIITICKMDLASFTPSTIESPQPKAVITVACSKGTYIRVLAEELAATLMTLGHLTALRRLSSGPYQIDQAITLEGLQALPDPTSVLRPRTV